MTMIAYRLVGRGDTWATITRSAREPGWQLTHFDGDGPVGHQIRESICEALDDALAAGLRLVEARGPCSADVAAQVVAYHRAHAEWLDRLETAENADEATWLAIFDDAPVKPPWSARPSDTHPAVTRRPQEHTT